MLDSYDATALFVSFAYVVSEITSQMWIKWVYRLISIYVAQQSLHWPRVSMTRFW